MITAAVSSTSGYQVLAYSKDQPPGRAGRVVDLPVAMYSSLICSLVTHSRARTSMRSSSRARNRADRSSSERGVPDGRLAGLDAHAASESSRVKRSIAVETRDAIGIGVVAS